MLIGALDIGSNTIKITVFDYDGSTLSERGRKSVPAGLISNITEGKLTEKGYRILTESMNTLRDYAASLGCLQVYPFATASLRAASNSEEIVKRAAVDTGLCIDLIPGEVEAALTFRSFTENVPDPGDGILLDMGGGSTEIIGFSGKTAEHRISLPFGALTLHNRFVRNILPTRHEAEKISDFVRQALIPADFLASCDKPIYLNGGSGKCLVKLAIGAFAENGEKQKESLPFTMDKAVLDNFLSEVLNCSPWIKSLLLRLVPERIHTIPTALIALDVILDQAGADRLTVTDAGVREGYLLDKLARDGERHG
ncbi:MAG: hypothetical protein ACI3YK_06840 [Eubacteriales bacterium]